MKILNQEKIRTAREKETHKYLEILKADTVKQVKTKNLKRVSQENVKATRKQTVQQEPFKKDKYLSCLSHKILENLLGMLPLIRYSGPFLKWTSELKQMDLRTRKLMTIHTPLHPRDDIDIWNVSKNGETGCTRIEDSVDESIQRLDD